MGTESQAQDLYWLQQQLNGAAAFIALTVIFVALKMTASLMKASKRRSFDVLGGNDALIIVSLLAFLPIGICEISQSNQLNTQCRPETLISGNSQRSSVHRLL